MDLIWAEWERLFRRARRRIAAEALLYPAVLLLGSTAGAVLLYRMHPGTIEPRTLLVDLWWALAVIGAAATPILERYRRFLRIRRWYRSMARAALFLDQGCGLVAALEKAAREEEEPHRDVLLTVAQEFSTGVSPGSALADRRCPRALAHCFTAAGNEDDLVQRLRDTLRSRAEKYTRFIQAAERLAPVTAIAGAGSVLLWLVIRVAIPILTHSLSGGLYE